jgi:hypothetical protein
VTHLVQSSFVANPVLADYQLPWMPRRSIASSPWRGSPLWSPKLLAQRTAQFHRARGKMLGSLLGLAGPLARADYDLDFARRATGGRSTSLAGHLDIETLYRVLGAAGPKHPSDTVVVVEPHENAHHDRLGCPAASRHLVALRRRQQKRSGLCCLLPRSVLTRPGHHTQPSFRNVTPCLR